MGKLLLTSSPGWDDELRSAFSEAGFSESAHADFGGSMLTTYKKLRVSSCNYCSEGEDYAACAGTLIYKERFGREALSELLHDARSCSVKELRRNLLGSYVIAVKTGNNIRVFVDETHIYKAYFYAGEKDYIITTTYYHIAKVTHQPLNEEAFIGYMSRHCTMSNQTPFQNVFKICAREYLSIDIEHKTFEIIPCELNDYNCEFTDKQEALECLFDRIKTISAIRSKFVHSYTVFLTGGLDSRLEYAIHRYNNDEVHPAYWMSQREVDITNGTPQDWAVVSQITHGGGGTSL